MLYWYFVGEHIIFSSSTRGSLVAYWKYTLVLITKVLPVCIYYQMQSVPITTNVESSIPTQVGCTWYNIMW
jgi:hypothetical protein